MSSSDLKIDQALLDVRKAYRILHDYQQMVLDAIKYIGNQLGLKYYGGLPQFSNASPGRDKGHLGLSPWDWLNMVFYEFYFRPEDEPIDKSLRFSILLISDSGYFDAEADILDKKATDLYHSPERSSTKIAFILSGPEYNGFEFTNNKAEMRTFIQENGKLPVTYATNGIHALCVDLSRLASEDSTDSLIKELVDFSNKIKIPLKLVAAKV